MPITAKEDAAVNELTAGKTMLLLQRLNKRPGAGLASDPLITGKELGDEQISSMVYRTLCIEAGRSKRLLFMGEGKT